ncbi:alpha/beta fold hydrolase [Ovoidimarina sediminis]|uniref:alpha/beta fold hydrolase n=1 Tax=Ovoidimarina sediminis TaxID=3079856 RepID=UPI0029089D95|nr:alpha/beta hydrolase [Rhodophyticola sp. MJ-SS7]MDU8943567.1 alpha/beta hydrolase [Rhodophyticola sp. MJ-SS7]
MARITANGLELEVEQFGSPSASPILLIRGLGSQIIHWPTRLIDGLVDSGFRVIAYDNRDAGLSQKLDGAGIPDIGAVRDLVRKGEAVRVPYSLHDMAADGVGVLDALEIERAHVLGISMGGMILQVMAHRYPGRVKSAAIVMSSSGAPGLPAASSEVMDMLTSHPPKTDRESVVTHTLMCDRAWASPLYPFDEAERRNLIGRAYDRSYYPEGATRQLAAITADTSRHRSLSALRMPVTVIHGTDDTLLPIEHGRDIASRIPNAVLVEIEGMGHDLEGAVPAMIVDHVTKLARRVT